MDIYQVIREPHITEKGTLQKEGFNQITFKVLRDGEVVDVTYTLQPKG